MVTNGIRTSMKDENLILLQCVKAGIPKYEVDVKRYLETFVPYVNDSVHFHMQAEQLLYFSDICFGTTDAIAFDENKNKLRIHDLKTGMTPAHMEQLYIYAALFCLEYDYNPNDIDIETRLYQNGKKIVEKPGVDIIFPIIDKIQVACEVLHEYEEDSYV